MRTLAAGIWRSISGPASQTFGFRPVLVAGLERPTSRFLFGRLPLDQALQQGPGYRRPVGAHFAKSASFTHAPLRALSGPGNLLAGLTLFT